MRPGSKRVYVQRWHAWYISWGHYGDGIVEVEISEDGKTATLVEAEGRKIGSTFEVGEDGRVEITYERGDYEEITLRIEVDPNAGW